MKTSWGWRFVLVAVAVSIVGGCDDGECVEREDHGDGLEGEGCVTSAECVEGLTCIGRNFEEEARCTPPSELPGRADPGCVEHPDDWSEHEAHGTIPTEDDDQGCQRLVFVNGCNCGERPTAEGCLPISPFFRREVWRICDGCCWRLVTFWQDDTACEGF